MIPKKTRLIPTQVKLSAQERADLDELAAILSSQRASPQSWAAAIRYAVAEMLKTLRKNDTTS
jgi:hypothetical protein